MPRLVQSMTPAQRLIFFHAKIALLLNQANGQPTLNANYDKIRDDYRIESPGPDREVVNVALKEFRKNYHQNVAANLKVIVNKWMIRTQAGRDYANRIRQQGNRAGWDQPHLDAFRAFLRRPQVCRYAFREIVDLLDSLTVAGWAHPVLNVALPAILSNMAREILQASLRDPPENQALFAQLTRSTAPYRGYQLPPVDRYMPTLNGDAHQYYNAWPDNGDLDDDETWNRPGENDPADGWGRDGDHLMEGIDQAQRAAVVNGPFSPRRHDRQGAPGDFRPVPINFDPPPRREQPNRQQPRNAREQMEMEDAPDYDPNAQPPVPRPRGRAARLPVMPPVPDWIPLAGNGAPAVQQMQAVADANHTWATHAVTHLVRAHNEMRAIIQDQRDVIRVSNEMLAERSLEARVMTHMVQRLARDVRTLWRQAPNNAGGVAPGGYEELFRYALPLGLRREDDEEDDEELPAMPDVEAPPALEAGEVRALQLAVPDMWMQNADVLGENDRPGRPRGGAGGRQ